MDKARPPHIHTAKGLTYRQADSPDDLPKMDLNYVGETDDSDFGGSTTIQVFCCCRYMSRDMWFPTMWHFDKCRLIWVCETSP